MARRALQAMKMLIYASAFIATVSISGCIYIPLPEYGGDRVIPEKTLEEIVPGKTTRADALLKLGSPTYRLEDDRYLVYTWWRHSDILLVFILNMRPSENPSSK